MITLIFEIVHSFLTKMKNSVSWEIILWVEIFHI